MRAYPATLMPDPDGGFTVTFREVPEAITESDSREEALLRAEDALESALAMYVAARNRSRSRRACSPARRWCLCRRSAWQRPRFMTRCASRASAGPNWRAG